MKTQNLGQFNRQFSPGKSRDAETKEVTQKDTVVNSNSLSGGGYRRKYQPYSLRSNKTQAPGLIEPNNGNRRRNDFRHGRPGYRNSSYNRLTAVAEENSHLDEGKTVSRAGSRKHLQRQESQTRNISRSRSRSVSAAYKARRIPSKEYPSYKNNYNQDDTHSKIEDNVYKRRFQCREEKDQKTQDKEKNTPAHSRYGQKTFKRYARADNETQSIERGSADEYRLVPETDRGLIGASRFNGSRSLRTFVTGKNMPIGIENLENRDASRSTSPMVQGKPANPSNLSSLKKGGILSERTGFNIYSPTSQSKRNPHQNLRNFTTFNAEKSRSPNFAQSKRTNSKADFNQLPRPDYERKYIPWAERKAMREFKSQNQTNMKPYTAPLDQLEYRRKFNAQPQLSTPKQDRPSSQEKENIHLNGPRNLQENFSNRRTNFNTSFGKEDRSSQKFNRTFQPSQDQSTGQGIPLNNQKNLDKTQGRGNPKMTNKGFSTPCLSSTYAGNGRSFKVPRNEAGVPMRRRPQAQQEDFRFRFIAPNRETR